MRPPGARGRRSHHVCPLTPTERSASTTKYVHPTPSLSAHLQGLKERPEDHIVWTWPDDMDLQTALRNLHDGKCWCGIPLSTEVTNLQRNPGPATGWILRCDQLATVLTSWQPCHPRYGQGTRGKRQVWGVCLRWFSCRASWKRQPCRLYTSKALTVTPSECS